VKLPPMVVFWMRAPPSCTGELRVGCVIPFVKPYPIPELVNA